ncbi:hypothetical protein HDU99_001874 [Rhizoclosmatium hyalinum]|nr:hypothetical protein HDU99_001874 [Rhizoclosmatium hyalinum]
MTVLNGHIMRAIIAIVILFLAVELALMIGYEMSMGHKAASLILKPNVPTPILPDGPAQECPTYHHLPASAYQNYAVLDQSELPYLEDDLPVLKLSGVSPFINSSTEYKGSKVICPKWEAYDKRIQMKKEFEGNCHPVKIGSQDFKVDMCQSELLCGQGYFKIERLDKNICKKDMEKELSWNKQVERYFKEKIGPDAFHIQFEGPERAAFSMWSHLGNCVYKFPFRLINPGNYTVNIMHAYKSFDAVNELKEDWSKPLMANLITKYPMEVCPHCPVYTDAIVQQMHHLPLCSRDEPTQGVFLRMTMETEREKYKFDNYKHPYIYAPLGCRFDQTFELHGNDTCMSNFTTHLLINGDSQSRIVWDLLDARLAGHKESIQANEKLGNRDTLYFSTNDLKNFTQVKNRFLLKDDDEEPKKKAKDVNSGKVVPVSDPRRKLHRLHSKYVGFETHLYSHINPIREWDDEKKVTSGDKFYSNYDAVLVNAGHWPASGLWAGGHFSIERYVDLIEYASDFMLVLNSRRHIFGKGPINYVWEGVNAFKIDDNVEGFAAKGADWRINYRLKIYSDFAERVFRRRGIKQMNSFDITLPWSQDSPDGAHLYTLPALDAQVDELLHKWNLCRV